MDDSVLFFNQLGNAELPGFAFAAPTQMHQEGCSLLGHALSTQIFRGEFLVLRAPRKGASVRSPPSVEHDLHRLILLCFLYAWPIAYRVWKMFSFSLLLKSTVSVTFILFCHNNYLGVCPLPWSGWFMCLFNFQFYYFVRWENGSYKFLWFEAYWVYFCVLFIIPFFCKCSAKA